MAAMDSGVAIRAEDDDVSTCLPLVVALREALLSVATLE